MSTPTSLPINTIQSRQFMDVKTRKQMAPSLFHHCSMRGLSPIQRKMRQKDLTRAPDEYVCFYCFVICVSLLSAK